MTLISFIPFGYHYGYSSSSYLSVGVVCWASGVDSVGEDEVDYGVVFRPCPFSSRISSSLSLNYFFVSSSLQIGDLCTSHSFLLTRPLLFLRSLQASGGDRRSIVTVVSLVVAAVAVISLRCIVFLERRKSIISRGKDCFVLSSLPPTQSPLPVPSTSILLSFLLL